MERAAFIFLAPQTDPSAHRSTVKTPTLDLDAIAVPTYAEAVRVAKDLVDQGLGIIELCGGFGIRGTYVVKQAVGDRAKIGVVRFDGHPGLDDRSGDELF